jgi:hypothetical protein
VTSGGAASIKANAQSTLVLVMTVTCAMAPSVGGIHRDGNYRRSHNVLGLAVEHEDCATTRLRGTTHGDGNGEPSSSADRSATDINCHEPRIDDPESKWRGYADGDNRTPRAGI